MKILLDTHILIWYLEGNQMLKSEFNDLIIDSTNIIYFSAVSLAEMAIKASKNKLRYPDNIIDICIEQGFKELSLKSKHSILLKDLPQYHSDPFDRLLIVQAQSEGIWMISQDQFFTKYDVKLVNYER